MHYLTFSAWPASPEGGGQAELTMVWKTLPDHHSCVWGLANPALLAPSQVCAVGQKASHIGAKTSSPSWKLAVRSFLSQKTRAGLTLLKRGQGGRWWSYGFMYNLLAWATRSGVGSLCRRRASSTRLPPWPSEWSAEQEESVFPEVVVG